MRVLVLDDVSQFHNLHVIETIYPVIKSLSARYQHTVVINISVMQ